VTGTITELHRDRGVGTLLGEDDKHYMFRRSDLRDVWFHDLTEGATVTFEAGKHLSAIRVRLVPRSA
jgi:cold shock CspA family protein